MVKIILKLDEIPKPDDAADALAIAITHINSKIGFGGFDRGDNITKKLNKNAKLALEAESILKWQEEQTELLIKQKENAIKNNKRDLQIAKMNLMNDLGLDLNADFRFVISLLPT